MQTFALLRGARALTMLAGILSGSACGGAVRPKVVEIETVQTSTAGNAITRVELTYRDDRLAEATVKLDGATVELRHFTYKADRLVGVEVEDADKTLVESLSLAYRDDRLSRFERRQPVTWLDPLVPPGEATLVALAAYGRDGVSRVTFTDTTLLDPLTAVVETWEERYRYDDQQRLLRVTSERSTALTLRELSYAEDSDLLEWVFMRSNAGTATTNYSYDDDGRLVGVAGQGFTWALTYSGDHIEELSGALGSVQQTTRYTYGDGEITGPVPVPDIPNAELFGMNGRNRVGIETLTLDTVM